MQPLAPLYKPLVLTQIIFFNIPGEPISWEEPLIKVEQQDYVSEEEDAKYFFDSTRKILGYYGNSFRKEGHGYGQRGNLVSVFYFYLK